MAGLWPVHGASQSADRPPSQRSRGSTRWRGALPPAFEWVPSPLAALHAVQAAQSRYPAIDTRRLLTDQPWREMPVAARLASLGTSLRSRLDARIRRAAVDWPRSPGANTGTVSMYRPEDAVSPGISDRSVVVVTAGQSLRGTLTDAVAAPLRAALAQAIGKAANDDQLKPAGGVVASRGQHDASWIGYYDARPQTSSAPNRTSKCGAVPSSGSAGTPTSGTPG